MTFQWIELIPFLGLFIMQKFMCFCTVMINASVVAIGNEITSMDPMG